MSDHELFVLIRQKIASGALPDQAQIGTTLGEGNGERCSACELPIRGANEYEYEVTMRDGHTFRFHRGCLELWHQVRANSR